MNNYFKEYELYQSYTANKHGINNKPSLEILNRLLYIKDNYLNPIRELYGGPINISSGYRSEKLNIMVGGSRTSNHLFGEAVDLVPVDGDSRKLLKIAQQFIEDSNLPFDELFFEKNSKGSIWVHLAVRQRKGTPNRSKKGNLYVK